VAAAVVSVVVDAATCLVDATVIFAPTSSLVTIRRGVFSSTPAVADAEGAGIEAMVQCDLSYLIYLINPKVFPYDPMKKSGD